MTVFPATARRPTTIWRERGYRLFVWIERSRPRRRRFQASREALRPAGGGTSRSGGGPGGEMEKDDVAVVVVRFVMVEDATVVGGCSGRRAGAIEGIRWSSRRRVKRCRPMLLLLFWMLGSGMFGVGGDDVVSDAHASRPANSTEVRQRGRR